MIQATIAVPTGGRGGDLTWMGRGPRGAASPGDDDAKRSIIDIGVQRIHVVE